MLLCIAVAAICTIMRTDNRNHKNIIMLKKLQCLALWLKSPSYFTWAKLKSNLGLILKTPNIIELVVNSYVVLFLF